LNAHLRSHRLMSVALDAIDAVHTAVIALDEAGHPIWKTARARQWLHTYFGLDPQVSGLPQALQHWVGEALMHTGFDQIPPYIQPGTDRQLVMRLARRPQSAPGELTLLIEEQPLPIDPRHRLAEQYR